MFARAYEINVGQTLVMVYDLTVAWLRHAIIWASADFSLVSYGGIELWAISRVPELLFCICLSYTLHKTNM